MSVLNRSNFLSLPLAFVVALGPAAAKADPTSKTSPKSDSSKSDSSKSDSSKSSTTTSSGEAASQGKPSSDCVQNFEDGQRLRKEGKLKAAAEALIACSQPTCPAFISKECTGLYSEAQSSLPSVTIRVTDGTGQLLTDVTVYADDALVQKQLDGRAIPLDPGVHEFRFEVAGKAPLNRKVLVAEGEKNKVVAAEFAPPASDGDASKSTHGGQKTTEPPALPAPSGPPVAAYIFGGLGVAAVGAGVALRLIADKDYSHYESTCSPNCKSSDIDALDTKYILSYVGFGVGGAALVTSGILFLVHAKSTPSAQSAGLSLAPLREGGMLAGYGGRF